MQIELRQRSFGELLGQSFSLVAAHFVKLFAIVALFGSPVLAVSFWQVWATQGAENTVDAATTNLVFQLVALVVQFLVMPIQQGASVLIVASSFTGEQPTLGECVKVSLRRFWPILALSVAIGVIVFLGSLLLIVPGLIFATWYYVSTPALLVERLSWQASLRRSKELSRGSRWGVFFFFFVTALLVGFIAGFIGSLAPHVVPNAYLVVLIAFIINCAVSTVSAVAPVACYFNLRIKNEAFDLEQLSRLVDAIAERGAAPASAST